MEFITSWFDQLDRFLKENLYNFSCNEYSEVYQSFLKVHYDRCGTSENLTGFSEYLTNRLFFFLLEEQKEFALSPVEPVNGIQGHNVPDLLIYKGTEICALISVKAVKKMKNPNVVEDLRRIDNVRHNGFKSLMINYLSHDSLYPKTIYKHQRDDHKLLFMDNNSKKLVDEVHSFLFK
ncbi:hypothetical protein [Heyndrickxia vini]|uniref:Uncharacterized protein n=1 Tax=Heyndrickxia vini TaxID=1476025 RepID=A0ABX7DZW5_9BACI|nr:hypothetical protein [Heyndrickxia vini]QQZ09018.1 hypothetical protein I5776_18835 [Heyndrickxia vini]